MQILIIEDDHDLAANLCEFFERQGWTVDVAVTGRQGLELAAAGGFDVIVLDLGLPLLDGVEVCRRLREEAGWRTPVLMLTARDTEESKLEGFDVGADDYVVKPFNLRELAARLRALARRGGALRDAAPLRVEDLELDPESRAVSRGGQPVKLHPIGFKLLELLMRETHRVVPRAELEQAIWGDEPPDSDALRTHIHKLRSTIDKPFERKLLETFHGVGFRLH